MLLGLLTGACFCLVLTATLPPVALAVTVLAITMAMLGMGNGSVFQLVPQRFPDRVGIMTGIVGAAGGLGGFFLPSLLGSMKDATGSFSTGFKILACCFLAGVVLLAYLRNVWRQSWSAEAAQRAGLLRPEMEPAGVYATE